MGTFLNILIPALILGYAAYLIVNGVRNRKKGGCSGCGGCPYANGCDKPEKSGDE